MLEDMRIRGFREKTQAGYVRVVKAFAVFLGRPPDKAADEFIRRFLLHVLPRGFHRIRHYGLLSNGLRAKSLTLLQTLLAVPASEHAPEGRECPAPICPHCGSIMAVVETFGPNQAPRRFGASWQPRAPPGEPRRRAA